MMNNKEPRNEIARKKKKEPYAMPRDFLNDLFNEERDNIREALEDVRQRSPNLYLKTMIEIGKLIIPKNGNIRVDHINHDLQFLEGASIFNPLSKLITVMKNYLIKTCLLTLRLLIRRRNCLAIRRTDGICPVSLHSLSCKLLTNVKICHCLQASSLSSASFFLIVSMQWFRYNPA